ncbi:MAG: cytochrome c oxidase assembly protein [Acidimicrobiia bacterium]|nr:cytochrome c oxidase assembly protein [Acidimicrobiia bacterium]
MNISWWCTALSEPWSWTFRAYPGIWLTVALLVGGYAVAVRRHTDTEGHTARHTVFFAAGVAVFWIASDWPLGTLGAGYLASAHMLQFVLYVLVAAPLLWLGTPEWMARRILSATGIYRPGRSLRRFPLLMGVIFNFTLVVTHTPIAVDNLRSSQFGSFAMDAVWLIAGLALWAPIVGSIREFTERSYPARMLYLFFTTGVVTILPASFLTFAKLPLYRTYELAPRVFGMTAIDDQQIAGLIMKLSAVPIVWPVLAGMMYRWAMSERSTS